MLCVTKVSGGVLSSNMYLINEDGSPFFWVIDVGSYQALESVLPESAQIMGCFLTHGHFDHIAGINLLHEKFPKCRIYTSEYGKEQLYSEKKNFSLYHEIPFVYAGDEASITILHEGDTINIYDNYEVKVIETPGHCVSCLSYITHGYVFTGDAYIEGVPVVTKLPKGDKFQAVKSVNKILSISANNVVCCGHDLENWKSNF